MSKVIVIGGGAAGMLAAISAARTGHKVILLEKNEKLGKKIYITGKGRCNITNACDVEDIFQNIIRNEKFMYSAIYTFSNFSIMELLEEEGLKLKVERGNRVFPESDHSSDVIATLKRVLEKLRVDIRLRQTVKNLIVENQQIKGVLLASRETVLADAVILATGGVSYETTGSTGDGFKFAKSLGIDVTPLRPSLVPFEIKEDCAKELQGLSLKNVTAKIFKDDKKIYEEFGEMLFTHFGVSGPIIISASSRINDYLGKDHLKLSIDLKPALSEEQLDGRLIREFQANQNKNIHNIMGSFLPAKMIPVFLEMCSIPGDKKIHDISKAERGLIISNMKNFSMTITGTREFKEAIITRGGIKVNEVNPSTMESKKIKGLYFAGEVLDVDALTGGYNLQIAWSTGYLAGMSIKEEP